MATEGNDATELADDITETPEATTPSKTSTPVTDAFASGARGELPTATVHEDGGLSSPTIDLAREASGYLDGARGLCAQLAAMESSDALRILEAGDHVIERLEAILTSLDKTKLDAARADSEAVSKYGNLPFVDGETLKKVQDAARKKAHDDLMADRTKQLEALAREVEHAAESLERQLAFEKSFADPDLREALDGQRDPRERSSEDYLVSRLEGQSVKEIADGYDLLLLDRDVGNADRVRRYERAAMRAVESIVAHVDRVTEAGNTLSHERRQSASKMRDEAMQLRQRIQTARAARVPKSIQHGEAIVRSLRSAWTRIAGFDARPGAGAVSAAQMNQMRTDDSKMAQARSQAKTWKPVEGWHGRHFRKAK